MKSTVAPRIKSTTRSNARPLVHLDVHSTETKEWLNRNMAERGITNPSKKLAIRRRMKHSNGNPRPIEEHGFDKVLRQIGIYSMTADPASLLIWSHYADAHKGICVEFSTGLWPFNLAWKVIYSSEYPVVD